MISSWKKSLLTVCACFCLAQTLAAQSVVINEVMSSNTRTLLDENGDSSDWIELYNAGAAPVGIAGYGMSADPASPAQQTTDDLQPQLSPAVAELNNQPALHFDGVNDLLTLPAPPAQDNFCFIVVARTFVGHEVDPQDAAGVGGVSGQHYLFGAT